MIRQRLTYANVMATVAVFIALGGSSYAALKLPRNSVGATQIRAKAVGSSELRTNAVTSSAIRNRSVTLSDVAPTARQALRGPTGPAGPIGPAGPQGPAGITYSAAINSGGGAARGNATATSGGGGTGQYTVGFDRDVSACQAVASLARVDGGITVDPPAGRVTVRPGSAGRVEVRTFDETGAAKDLPFNVIVAC